MRRHRHQAIITTACGKADRVPSEGRVTQVPELRLSLVWSLLVAACENLLAQDVGVACVLCELAQDLDL